MRENRAETLLIVVLRKALEKARYADGIQLCHRKCNGEATFQTVVDDQTGTSAFFDTDGQLHVHAKAHPVTGSSTPRPPVEGRIGWSIHAEIEPHEFLPDFDAPCCRTCHYSEVQPWHLKPKPRARCWFPGCWNPYGSNDKDDTVHCVDQNDAGHKQVAGAHFFRKDRRTRKDRRQEP